MFTFTRDDMEVMQISHCCSGCVKGTGGLLTWVHWASN